MKGHIKRITALLLILLMVFSSYSAAFAADTGEMTPEYNIMPYSEHYDIFSNYVHGYEVYVDADMEIDTTHMGIVTVFENETKRIEIYRQFTGNISRAGYINYSNKFLEGAGTNYYTDVTSAAIESVWEDTGETREVQITKWSRPALSRIENDKNNYVCIEIPKGNYVYTIFIKSSEVIDNPSEYEKMIESFRTFIPSVKAPEFKAGMIDPSDRDWNRETREFYETYLHADAPLSWGIFEPDTDWKGYEQLDKYEEDLDYDFPVILSYGEVENTSIEKVEKRLEDAYDHGKVLELTLQTNWTGNGNMVYDILDGKHDEYLYEYAETIADFGHPVLFRLFNEMNGDWCPYSAYNYSKDTLIFREVYQYIYGIFEEEGANENTIWIWNPNEGSFPDFNWNHTLMYWPGEEYVDIIGLTAYNTGTYYAGETWKTFSELYSGMYNQYSEWFEHPFMITEFACASTGGDKAAWMHDMFRKIYSYDNIKIAIWWDGCDWDAQGNIARSYFLDETPETFEEFKRGIVPPWYLDVYA